MRLHQPFFHPQYLLANREKETTVCRENGGECKRDADPVRKYLGLRSTTDPLFQIEKVFGKVRFMEGLDVDKLVSLYGVMLLLVSVSFGFYALWDLQMLVFDIICHVFYSHLFNLTLCTSIQFIRVD